MFRVVRVIGEGYQSREGSAVPDEEQHAYRVETADLLTREEAASLAERLSTEEECDECSMVLCVRHLKEHAETLRSKPIDEG